MATDLHLLRHGYSQLSLRSARSIWAVAASMSALFLVCAAFSSNSAAQSQCGCAWRHGLIQPTNLAASPSVANLTAGPPVGLITRVNPTLKSCILTHRGFRTPSRRSRSSWRPRQIPPQRLTLTARDARNDALFAPSPVFAFAPCERLSVCGFASGLVSPGIISFRLFDLPSFVISKMRFIGRLPR